MQDISMVIQEQGGKRAEFTTDPQGRMSRDGKDISMNLNLITPMDYPESGIDLEVFTIRPIPLDEPTGSELSDIVFKSDFTGSVIINGHEYRIASGALEAGAKEAFLEDVHAFSRKTIRKIMIGERELEVKQEAKHFREHVEGIFDIFTDEEMSLTDQAILDLAAEGGRLSVPDGVDKTWQHVFKDLKTLDSEPQLSVMDKQAYKVLHAMFLELSKQSSEIYGEQDLHDLQALSIEVVQLIEDGVIKSEDISSLFSNPKAFEAKISAELITNLEALIPREIAVSEPDVPTIMPESGQFETVIEEGRRSKSSISLRSAVKGKKEAVKIDLEAEQVSSILQIIELISEDITRLGISEKELLAGGSAETKIGGKVTIEALVAARVDELSKDHGIQLDNINTKIKEIDDQKNELRKQGISKGSEKFIILEQKLQMLEEEADVISALGHEDIKKIKGTIEELGQASVQDHVTEIFSSVMKGLQSGQSPLMIAVGMIINGVAKLLGREVSSLKKAVIGLRIADTSQGQEEGHEYKLGLNSLSDIGKVAAGMRGRLETQRLQVGSSGVGL